MKVIEKIFEHRIRQQIEIDDMQFRFTKGKGTNNATFMARQMQENFRVKGKSSILVVDLQKAFDRVPREVNSKGFEVKVGMHQGSALSPLLFVIVREAISREFRVALPWELLYADDLAVVAETEEELIKRLNVRKDNAETKGTRVNMNKTKVMISGERQKVRQKAVRWPCGVCSKGVGSNSLQCTSRQK